MGKSSLSSSSFVRYRPSQSIARCRSSYEADLSVFVVSFIWNIFGQGFLKKNEKKLAQSFNFTFCYIDDVLSLNNSKLGDFVDPIYPKTYPLKHIYKPKKKTIWYIFVHLL
jgi:hypothetical protein